MDKIVKGKRYKPELLFRAIRRRIGLEIAGFRPYMALFGCSDEVNTAVDMERSRVFGKHGGIFTTRIIGSQVFFHQIRVAISMGHHSNVFEVNVHIGENKDGSLGTLLGRDGHTRDCCGALAHVLRDSLQNPGEKPDISQRIDGEVYLDFLSTLKFRIYPQLDKILDLEDRMFAITRVNLDVQIAELTRQLQKYLSTSPLAGPMFVFGTVSYNHVKGKDFLSLERFLLLGPEVKNLI